MGTIYSGDHSIDFWKTDSSEILYKNTWDTFHLIPSSRPYIVNPEPRLQIVNVPLTNKRIDRSSYLPEGLTYELQKGQWEFYIDNDTISSKEWYPTALYYTDDTKWAWEHYKLFEYFKGGKFEFQLQDLSPIKSYKGRITVSGYSPEADYSKVTLDYYILDYSLCSPMVLRQALLREFIKLKIWLWDPFNFNTDTVPEAIEREANNRLIEGSTYESDIPYPGIGYRKNTDWSTGSEMYTVVIHDIKNKTNSKLLTYIQKALHVGEPNYTAQMSDGYTFHYYGLN